MPPPFRESGRRIRSAASRSRTSRACSRSTAANAARSEASCAILLPEGVTRCVNISDAASSSSGLSPSSARSRCASTIRPAPPSSLSVARRSTCEPRSRSSCQIRSITSWRYGASTHSLLGSWSTVPRPGTAYAISPAATPSSTASASAGSISTPCSSPTRREYCSTGATIERIEPQEVREQVRDPWLEGVELGERVLPDADQHPDRHVGSLDEVGQVGAEPARGRLAVVEEVLLEHGESPTSGL